MEWHHCRWRRGEGRPRSRTEPDELRGGDGQGDIGQGDGCHRDRRCRAEERLQDDHFQLPRYRQPHAA